MPTRLALSILATVMLADCASRLPAFGTQQEAERQRTGWAAADIRDYSLTVRLRCFCPNVRYTVVVKNGEPHALKTLDGSLDSWPPRYIPRTVEDLYEVIERNAETAYSVDVTYNDVGVPTNIAVDRQANAVDDEFGYQIRFTPASADQGAG